MFFCIISLIRTFAAPNYLKYIIILLYILRLKYYFKAKRFLLSGQRLSKMQKGINIINGKKVLK